VTRPPGPVALAAALGVLGALGCADAGLGTLELRAWQPENIVGVDGRLLDDAERVEVHLEVDGEVSVFALDDDLHASALPAGEPSSALAVELRTTGGAFPDAIARSGRRVLPEDGSGDVVAAVLAPPGVVHGLSDDLPDARDEPAVCAAPDGRLWVVGGERAGALVPGSFVVTPDERAVVEGPGLVANRSGGSCAWTDAGLWLFGGCDAAGALVDGLWWSTAGTVSTPFAEVQDFAGVSATTCHGRLVPLPDGRLFLVDGQASLYDPSSNTVTGIELSPPRYGAQVVAFADEPAAVVVAGGFSDATLETPLDDVVLLVDDGEGLVVTATLLESRVISPSPAGPVALQADEVVRLARDGSLLRVAVDATADATALAPLGPASYALLRPDGAGFDVVTEDSAPLSIPLETARPGASLSADPGGALRLAGGGVRGISVLVGQ
jgi:hypothetical protein